MLKKAGDFEDPILEIEKKIAELSTYPRSDEDEQAIRELRRELARRRKRIYSRLTPWQKTLVARHPERPYTLDYVQCLCDDFLELHGDRRYADDKAIVGGLASFRELPVVVIGHQKGRTTHEKLDRNFGMARPEGYRKALRLMKLAGKFHHPVLTFIDTPGAYPGIGAEERGQAEAIASNLREMTRLPVPIIATITGEGGSGGALAIAVADRVNMLEHAIYSVISPEGCAAILWKDAKKAEQAAMSLSLTAQDLEKLGLIDEIIPEVEGGAHTDTEKMADFVGETLERQIHELREIPADELLAQRFEKFREMGDFAEKGSLR